MNVDPLALTRAAIEVAGDRPVLEVAVELANAAGQVEQLLARLGDATRFAATIEHVELEASSTRALVTVRARDDQDPEILRTDRTDGADGWGAVIAARARRLLGRRVVVWKLLEDAGTDRRVRVLVWLDAIDAGAPDPKPDPAPAAAEQATGGAREPEPDPATAPAEQAAGGAREASPVQRVVQLLGAAEVPRANGDALARARYGVADLEHLDDEQAAVLAQRLEDRIELARFRQAAAADRRAELAGEPDVDY